MLLLLQVSTDEWEAIPDIGDYTIKKRPRTTYAPAPDSLIAGAANALATANSVGPDGLATPMSGTASVVSDLTAMGRWGQGMGSGGRGGLGVGGYQALLP